MSKKKKNIIDKKQAIRELWRRGTLDYPLHKKQEEIKKSLLNSKEKINVVLCARRFGKTYVLLNMAVEHCIKNPGSIVKYVSPQQKQGINNIRENMRVILKDCPSTLKPEWKVNDKKYIFPNGSEIQVAGTDNGSHESLRGGCFTGDTEILTPYGPKKIKDLDIGDKIYGYDKKGKVRINKVKNKFYNGIQKVTEIFIRGKYIGACTDSHRWLTKTKSSYFRRSKKTEERKFKDINDKNRYICRSTIDITAGHVNEKDAYLIGAFIGDGCCTEKGNILKFSTIDIEIANYISKHLGVGYKNEIKKHNRVIYSSNLNKNKHSRLLTFNYYDDWLRNKKYDKKNFDYNIVDKWNKKSCYKLLAGLLDTDGNVYFNKEGIELTFNHSNLSLIKNIQKLIFKLFQYRSTIKEDKRPEKYTQPHYKLIIRSSFTVKRILNKLDNYIILDRKKWKKEYEKISPSEKSDIAPIRKGNSWYDHTYDIEVDNDSHLYLTADGLVTHNSADMCIVDEAGFCDHLDYVIKSILRPTTLTTGGNIYLVSTPSKLHSHEFIQKFVLPYSAAGKIKKYTIYDNPMLSEKDIAELLLDYPDGENDPDFQREYLCKLVQDRESVVIPEFTENKKEALVREVKKPPYYDAYVSGDVGFKDLTHYIFGYWDFAKARLVIEDELVLNGPEMTTENLAKYIKAKEETLFVDKFNEPQTPYLRVMDNNLIMVNDLARLHGLNFIPTRKDDKEAQINQVRMMFANNQIIINPKCKNLIYHIENATWDKNHKGFDRIQGSAELGIKPSHADGLDSLIYLVRNLVRSKNPYPPGYNLPSDDTHYVKQHQRDSEITQTIKKIFNIKNK